MQTKTKLFSNDMVKITENTEFDFWHSEKADKDKGNGSYVNGKPYSERIIKGRKPYLSRKYRDLVLVYSGSRGKLVFKRS